MGCASVQSRRSLRPRAEALASHGKNPECGLSHRERDANYRGVVVQLNPAWRVIVCRHGIQWILQRRDAVRAGRPRWTGVGYFTTREALLRVSRTSCGPIAPAGVAALVSLPAKIKAPQHG